MTAADPPLSLADGRRLVGLSYLELWIRYVGLGGPHDLDELRHHVDSAHCPDPHDHTVIAQALNEVFLEQGHRYPVAYQHFAPGLIPRHAPRTHGSPR